MVHRTNEAYFRDLESSAHLPEVQELIREEIQNGTIRVRPKPGGGIQILPVGMPEIEGSSELETPPAPSKEGPSLPQKWLAGVASYPANGFLM